MNQPVTLSTEEATDLLRKGEAPDHLRVQGSLWLHWWKEIAHLPTGLQVNGDLGIQGTSIKELPSGLTCCELYAGKTALKRLPDDLHVANKISLNDCTSLEVLPAGLQTSRLDLRGCHALKTLPEDLDVFFLNIADCIRLRVYPERGPSTLGLFNMQGCIQLPGLPPWLQVVGQLNISDCPAMTQWPATLQVRTWADIANTRFPSLPEALKEVQLRWHGVPITEHIAFAPETITMDEVIGESNVELRRVLIRLRDGFLCRIRSKLYADNSEETARGMIHIPRGRLGRVEEVAGVVAYRVSDDAGFVTASSFLYH